MHTPVMKMAGATTNASSDRNNVGNAREQKIKATKRSPVNAKLQTRESKRVQKLAEVSVRLLPSERMSIYQRFMEHDSAPETEAFNHNVPRSMIYSVLRLERMQEIARAKEIAYNAGKREGNFASAPVGPRSIFQCRRRSA